jgi:gas vesicle protein
MPAAADPNAPWDALTAIFTGLLLVGVVIAAWSVWEARNASREDRDATKEASEKASEDAKEELEATRQAAKEASDAASRQLAAAKQQLQASYRPLLIDVLPNGPITADMESFSYKPGIRGDDKQAVMINVGGRERGRIDPRSVLVDISSTDAIVSVPLRNVGRGLAEIYPESIEVSASAAIIDTTVDRRRVPPNETTRVSVAFKPELGADSASGFFVSVTYSDFAGEQTTVADVHLIDIGEGDWRFEWILQRELELEPTPADG